MHLPAVLSACLFAAHAMAHSVHGGSPSAAKASSAAAAASIPKTFRALVAKEAGSSFRDVARIAELETPTKIGEGEVLVRVRYAGVNGGHETFRVRGDEKPFEDNKHLQDFRLGSEGVGTVVAVGEGVESVKAGDAVCFVGNAFSEYTVAKNAMVWKVRDTQPGWVGLPISALTSCAMLEETGKIRPGETVLITAAAGGAGHYAVQIAKEAGCTVIGTCGSDEKAELLEFLGCDHAINYRHQNVKEELRKIAPGGLDCVLEGVGGSMLETALECLGPEGRLLMIGYISEYAHNDASQKEKADVGFDVAEVFWGKQTIRRGKQTIIGNAWPKDFAGIVKSKQRVLELYEQRKLKSIVDRKKFVGLEEVPDAIEHMLSGKNVGKVVVEIP